MVTCHVKKNPFYVREGRKEMCQQPQHCVEHLNIEGPCILNLAQAWKKTYTEKKKKKLLV